jgi:hypothetical protein
MSENQYCYTLLTKHINKLEAYNKVEIAFLKALISKIKLYNKASNSKGKHKYPTRK